jgi:hypothetical protein
MSTLLTNTSLLVSNPLRGSNANAFAQFMMRTAWMSFVPNPFLCSGSVGYLGSRGHFVGASGYPRITLSII